MAEQFKESKNFFDCTMGEKNEILMDGNSRCALPSYGVLGFCIYPFDKPQTLYEKKEVLLDANYRCGFPSYGGFAAHAEQQRC